MFFRPTRMEIHVTRGYGLKWLFFAKACHSLKIRATRCPLQIVMTVVCPVGKLSQTRVGQSLGQFTGHILHLVPGEYQYEPPQFTIVIGWNQIDHFWPTELSDQNQVYEWKLALCHQYLNAAVQMFQETESQLQEEEDTVLLDAMNTLRNQMEVTRHLLHQRVNQKKLQFLLSL